MQHSQCFEGPGSQCGVRRSSETIQLLCVPICRVWSWMVIVWRSLLHEPEQQWPTLYWHWGLQVVTSRLYSFRFQISHFSFRSECSSRGGSLASIHSKEEDDFVFNMIQPHGDYYGPTFLGATFSNISGVFEWYDNTPWDYQNWNLGDIYFIKTVSDGIKWTVFQDIALWVLPFSKAHF